MTKINAQVVADSINPQGNRITTMLLTYPRFIHGELLTHRVFSKNSASSRAIPFEKMVKMVEEDPFIPYAWQKSHSGMQGSEYFSRTCREEFGHLDRAFAGYDQYKDKPSEQQFIEEWLEARDNAVQQAKVLNYLGVTKQLCNRLLEPFMWHTVLLTGTEFENFFELRCPQYEVPYTWDKETKIFKSRKDATKYWKDKADKDKTIGQPKEITEIEWLRLNKGQAEIHMAALAEAMWDAMNESTPKELKAGEWHIPFGDQMDEDKIETLLHGPYRASYVRKEGDVQQAKIEIATARCARLSYMTFDGEIDYEKDLKLHDTLLKSHHMSPFEHCARAMSDEEYNHFIKGEFMVTHSEPEYEDLGEFPESAKGWCNNFKGFIQYRAIVEEHI